jgi:hypothetical protein
MTSTTKLDYRRINKLNIERYLLNRGEAISSGSIAHTLLTIAEAWLKYDNFNPIYYITIHSEYIEARMEFSKVISSIKIFRESGKILVYGCVTEDHKVITMFCRFCSRAKAIKIARSLQALRTYYKDE